MGWEIVSAVSGGTEIVKGNAGAGQPGGFVVAVAVADNAACPPADQAAFNVAWSFVRPQRRVDRIGIDIDLDGHIQIGDGVTVALKYALVVVIGRCPVAEAGGGGGEVKVVHQRKPKRFYLRQCSVASPQMREYIRRESHHR